MTVLKPVYDGYNIYCILLIKNYFINTKHYGIVNDDKFGFITVLTVWYTVYYTVTIFSRNDTNIIGPIIYYYPAITLCFQFNSVLFRFLTTMSFFLQIYSRRELRFRWYTLER